MKRRVVITGWGLVTSLSNDVDDCWQRVLDGESGIHQIEIFENDDIKVNIGCLLYTSPSPRDATLSRMPSSA